MTFWLDKEESKRVREIAHVLFENRLGYYMTPLKLRRKLPFSKRVKSENFKKTEVTPQLVLKIFEDINGSFIKLGQLLSMRPDLIPMDYCKELSKLQDTVKPFPAQKAREIIEKELGKPLKKIFSEFQDEPVAAASMGQVHLAKLKDGTKVAVKVQRPEVSLTVKTDIKLLYRLASIIRKRFGSRMLDPVEIVREFERYTENELNYLKEAHNIDMFHNNFKESKTILIPKVFWKNTTSRVLTMEYIPGKRLTDITKFTAAQRRRLLETILNAELEQVFIHGIFHADPHPGNFIVKRNGKVALLDFGIVGRMDYVLKEHMTDFFVSMISKDIDGMVEAGVKLGVVSQTVDTENIKRDIYDRLAAYHGTELEKIRISEALTGIIWIFRENDLKVSSNLVLLAKATVTMESLATLINPKLNFVEVAKPFVKRLVKERMQPRRIAERARKKVETIISFAESIPGKATAALSELHDTTRDLKRIDMDLGSLATEMDRSSNRITLGFLAGTLFIASTILVPFESTRMMGVSIFSLMGYVAALVVTVALFVSIVKEKKWS